jgi:hypothetical protein
MKIAPDFVPCPGCGALAVAAAGAPGFTRCPRCATPLVLFNRDLDVERAVRERLYGRAETQPAAAAHPRGTRRRRRRQERGLAGRRVRPN